ncbi:MAG: DNA polymerase III subunit epsilon [Pseudomonadales bacterium]|nr:DNA polymerase III subunit epsilon [Pseudomonadales bacterium]
MRQVVLDTETTGLSPQQGHRIIEIGCVELVDRKLTGKHYHQYIKPERDIDEGAQAVHGISSEFLADKPVFSQIYPEFFEFIKGAELIIHNAPFDIGFINHEIELLQQGKQPITDFCRVVDTLAMAKSQFPGQKNNLDALCRRFFVDNSQRTLHGALLDAEILADVYLVMTGGQTSLALSAESEKKNTSQGGGEQRIRKLTKNYKLKVIAASQQELAAHEKKLDEITSFNDGGLCIWRKPSI